MQLLLNTRSSKQDSASEQTSRQSFYVN